MCICLLCDNLLPRSCFTIFVVSTLSKKIDARDLDWEDNTVSVDSLLGGICVGICGACIGNGLISGPVSVAVGVTFGSDSSFVKNKWRCGYSCGSHP